MGEYQTATPTPMDVAKHAAVNGAKPSEGSTALPGTDIHSEWVYVTPDIAYQYLDHNTNNRNRKERQVKRLASDMVRDRYRVTHEGLAFDTNGELVDGQHRLFAITISRKPQWMLVTTNLDPYTRSLVDAGARRTPTDFMTGKHRQEIGGAIRIIITLESMNMKFTPSTLHYEKTDITNPMIHEQWERYPNAEHLADKARKASRNVQVIAPTPLLVTALLYPERGEEFLDGLINMSDLSRDDPRLALIKYRGTPGKQLSQDMQIALCVKACKAFTEGLALRNLRIVSGEVVRV